MPKPYDRYQSPLDRGLYPDEKGCIGIDSLSTCINPLLIGASTQTDQPMAEDLAMKGINPLLIGASTQTTVVETAVEPNCEYQSPLDRGLYLDSSGKR